MQFKQLSPAPNDVSTNSWTHSLLSRRPPPPPPSSQHGERVLSVLRAFVSVLLPYAAKRRVASWNHLCMYNHVSTNS
jgi:hypothetical protein